MQARKPINVAITGNAPFLEWDYNTSLMVRDALPDKIEQPGKRDIVIRKYARVTRDTYDDVRRVSRDIWGGQRSLFLPALTPGDKDDKVDVDFILHLGMEIRDEYFGFETIARRDGYKTVGDDGKCVDSEELKREGLPQELSPKFDVKSAWQKVKAEFPKAPIRLSNDAGLYFCEFRLYSSLAEAELNYPGKRDLATKITVAYISALADDQLLADEEPKAGTTRSASGLFTFLSWLLGTKTT